MNNFDRIQYEQIIKISTSSYPKYINRKAEWKDSPFSWILSLSSRTKGALSEEIVSQWLKTYDFNIKRCPDSDADRIVEGKRVEIKFSTLWKNGIYKFQQIRDQKYDLLILLGISPHTAHCWAFEKEKFIDLWKNKKVIPTQHGGSSGSDTAWLPITPTNQQEFLKPANGSLSEAIKLIAKLTNYSLPSLQKEFDQ